LAPISFEVNRLLKKWAFLSVAAALVVIGCGGSGGGGTSGSTTSTTSTIPGTNVRINLGNANSSGTTYGHINFYYLTGQGRGSRAAGDLVANIRDVTIEDEFGSINAPGSGSGATFNLVSFQVASFRLDVPFNGQNSRLFANYELRFDHFTYEGSLTRLDPPVNSSTFPARIRVFPGRDTTVPIFLDDAMFTVNGSSVSFDESRFIDGNESGNPPAIQSFVGDYVEFDISALPVASRPQLLTGDFAGRFFISGDNYAIGQAGDSGTFEVMTEDSQRFSGTYGSEHTIGQYTPGTYTLYQADPSDINGLAKIISIAGGWRSNHRVISNPGAFEIITFPTHNDNAHQEMVAVQFDGSGNPTNLYFGFLNFDNGKFEIHPVKAITDPTDFTGVLTGTVSGYSTASGAITSSPNAVRYGHYLFDSGQSLPSGFQSEGTFVVFRQ